MPPSYVVPSLPPPLPNFPSMRQAPANAVSVLTVLPQAGDMEQMREKLEQLSRELCTFQAMASEAQAEKELLAAERTQMVIELQALSACLSLHDDEEAGLHRGRFDAKAAEEAAARVARLRCALPPGSSVRALCEASEMLPFAQGDLAGAVKRR
ncbi:hypothetical protein FOA52_013774 [Chlamydomonas sp. UWO 241]|nr:hypothetical protein FOA52_013774 [Chlamydomonas sp. UWO 241]